MAKKKRTKKMWELTPDEWIERLAKSMNKTGLEQEDFFNKIQDEIIRLTDKIDDIDEKLDELAEIDEERELTVAEEAQYDGLMNKSDIEREHFTSLYTSLSILLNIYMMYAFAIPEKIVVMISANILVDLMSDDLYSLIMKHTNVFFSYYVLMTRDEEPDFTGMEERNAELLDNIEEELSNMLDNFIGDDDEDFDDEEIDYDEFLARSHHISEEDDDSTPPILS